MEVSRTMRQQRWWGRRWHVCVASGAGASDTGCRSELRDLGLMLRQRLGLLSATVPRAVRHLCARHLASGIAVLAGRMPHGRRHRCNPRCRTAPRQHRIWWAVLWGGRTHLLAVSARRRWAGCGREKPLRAGGAGCGGAGDAVPDVPDAAPAPILLPTAPPLSDAAELERGARGGSGAGGARPAGGGKCGCGTWPPAPQALEPRAVVAESAPRTLPASAAPATSLAAAGPSACGACAASGTSEENAPRSLRDS
eukprot:349635-Chlamydomonas_euryale.AAC.2